ncbi:transmembrane and coiled-coil domain-containing protein 4 isoform X2 [Dendrobates tinctorius]|uniref:transmembrane and coiled-coil domain-containing protein 4 isoform X2 n=1 Tax=Dendrobates tinctorius TaxID=92724 RepID=UPI003CC9A43A
MQDESDGRVVPLGRSLSEPSRFAYAGLCGLSLAQLYPEKGQREFCRKFVEDLVQWLDLSPSVIAAMEAFASGLGVEGTDTFTHVLLEDSVLRTNPTIITQDLVSFCLRDGYYDARSRVLISHVSWLLRVPPETVELSEETMMQSLKKYTEEPSESEQASRRKKESRKKMKRYLLIGLATVGGGTVIGLTGGLAAPLVAAGAATIIGSAGAAVLGSTAGIAIMASLFGAAGAGLTGYKMKKRVGAIEEFEFLPLTGGCQLQICIAITGWLSTGKYGSFAAPWHSLLHSTEQYCLAWESKYLMELGNTLDTLLNGLVNIVAQEALKYTILSGTAAGHPHRLQPGSSGHLLLSAGAGTGGRSRGDHRGCGTAGSPRRRGDWLLSFVYRSSSVKLSVAGLQPVDLDDRRMVNVDLSSVVNGHLDYMKQMDTILKAVGIKTKECRLEEQNALLHPPAGSTALQQSSETAEKTKSDQDNSPWDWEPITTPSLPQSLCVQCGAAEAQESFCKDCANNNTVRKNQEQSVRKLDDAPHAKRPNMI